MVLGNEREDAAVAVAVAATAGGLAAGGSVGYFEAAAGRSAVSATVWTKNPLQ